MPTLLYILRHAWAYEYDAVRWPNDGDRPLTKEGISRFQAVAKTLVERGCAPEVIATSPLIRCRQTADLLAAEVNPIPAVVELPALAPGSDLQELLAWSGSQQVESLAWVGHAPDVGQLLAALLGSKFAGIRFAKGSAACVRFDGPVASGQGELQWHVTAKILGC
jgi:phosphohistidine phosphatase